MINKRFKQKNRKIHSHIHLLFHKWLHKNKYRFCNAPIRIHSGVYIFDGITKQVQLLIFSNTEETVIAFSDEQGINYDYHTLDYIENAKYIDNKGWYDSYRLDDRRYFKKYDDMLIAYLFESIIDYVNRYFNDRYNLYLTNGSGFTSAQIKEITKQTSISRHKAVKLFHYNICKEWIQYI